MLVNPFSGKVRSLSYLRSELLAVHSKPDLKLQVPMSNLLTKLKTL